MPNKWNTGIVLCCGLLLFHPAKAGAPENPDSAWNDFRINKLDRFFESYQCPVRDLTPAFLEAADRYGLDWRLLPSIALIESGGGKEYRRNNIFGWGNGDIRFRSVEAGIDEVAERLAHSDYYKDKNLDAVLNTYNPVPGYVSRVKNVMAQLGPE